MRRGFYFQTNKNRYFYNDVDGKTEYCGEIRNNESIEEDIIYGEKCESDKCELENVKEYISATGFKQLILMVTQDCNLRCKYCAYSGEYANQREHSKMKMSFKTAKKAIDKYFEAYKKTRKYDLMTIPAIGFYGGEPFLEFDLIRKSVKYIKEIFDESVCLLVTTNGTIMNEDIVRFLVENKINVTVSLNGYKEENDRMRVYINGKGTYDDIYKNLMLIRKIDKDYYKKHVTLSGVMDFGTDLEKLCEFYENNKELPSFARNSMVLDYFTDWYERYSEEDRKIFFDKKDAMFNKFVEKIENREYKKINNVEKIYCADSLRDVFNRSEGVEVSSTKPPFLKYTGTCVPGDKIAIAPDGSIHCCEKVNLSRPIGNVDEWIDYEKVCEIIDDYNDIIVSKCSDCPIQRMCSVCYTACMNDSGEMVLDNIEDCKSKIDYYKKQFSFAYEILEKGADIDIDKMLRGE